MLSQIQASSPPPPPSRSAGGITSPLLQALVTNPQLELPNSAARSTTEWAGDIPFGRSPPETRSNEPSLAGSPPDPAQPYDGVQRGFDNVSPPTSPSVAYRQPVRRNNTYQGLGDHLSSSPGRARPVSIPSHYPQAPPLPHQAQAHFYGAPEIDFGLNQSRKDSRMSRKQHCCAFDSLSSAGNEGSCATDNVLLVGLEGELDVYRFDQKRFDLVGRIAGLRGRVVGAKILPPLSQNDLAWPLVALVIHGYHNLNQSDTPSRPATSQSDEELFDPAGSILQAPHGVGNGPSKSPNDYQTSVNVYTLRDGRYVTTLLKSPTPEVDSIQGVPLPAGHAPVRNLTIQAKGKYVVIGSGISGELFIFGREAGKPDDPSYSFTCMGKVWTHIPTTRTRSHSMSSNSSETESLQANPKPRPLEMAPFSLSHRWLCIIPPPPSSQTTLHATVDAIRGPKPPGLTSHTSPTEPQTTCDLETPEGESVLSKVARDLTQEVIKGARWVGDRGMQAWNSYWTRPLDQQSPSQQNHLQNNKWDQTSNQAFPPTHANDELSSRPAKQPALISILDLDKLSDVQNQKPALALQPVATFSLPYGCSSVSFSPSGLTLFTASAKGDVQHIWDLLRMIHGETGYALARPYGQTDKKPVVREVARFTRFTVAKIVDVVWTEPRGERFAIVTERGTVHIFDLPPSAMQWPPPRRAVRSASLPVKPKVSDPEANTLARSNPAGNKITAALDLVTGTTQPILAAVRGRPPTGANAFTSLGGFAFPSSAGARGSKVVTASLSKGVGAAAGTVNTLRHIGENRLALPGSSTAVYPGCLRWLSGKDQGLIAVAGRDVVRIHSIRQSTNRKAAKRRPSVRGGKVIEFSLSNASSSPAKPVLGNELAVRLTTTNERPLTSKNFWIPRSPDTASRRPWTNNMHPLSMAEIETNAPYQPFHTDHRITFYVYPGDSQLSPPAARSAEPHLADPAMTPAAPWAFGEPIPAIKTSTGSSFGTDAPNSASVDDPCGTDPAMVATADLRTAGIENVVSVEGHGAEGQHVVVTTRRKRGRKGERRGGEEIFEDDCEVVDFAEERV